MADERRSSGRLVCWPIRHGGRGGDAEDEGGHFYASSERFGYLGTVSVYNTLKDAKSGKNARCSNQVWPQRDGGIFAVKGAPEYWTDSNIIATNGWANNWASPSDTNFGYFQLYDDNASTWQDQEASWSDDRNTFTLKVKGLNATYGPPGDEKDYARLWNACAVQGSGETTRGTFLTYDYKLIATGLNGVDGPADFIKNTTNASDYRGHFRGIFRNESVETASNGYYVFDIQFNNISWAAANNCGYDGPLSCGGPAFPDDFGGKK